MKLYNTLTNGIEEFSSTDEVKLYVCGVTPYDTTHLGHARTYIVFDQLVRHLMDHGKKVRYIQNITDIDDSILARAEKLDEPFDQLGDRYAAIYMNDIAQLGLIPAEDYPKATVAIEAMQEVILRLLKKGHAYEVDGDVFFRISSWAPFGILSRLTREEMIEREAQQDAPTLDDERKEDPLDFPLWQAQKPGEPAWDSPWGPGRPGWHIECTTLAIANLGLQLDIHGGGDDLVYPHHECEIAQAEAATNRSPFCRFWMHVAMVQLNGKKMSKSDGNMIFVRDLLAKHSADAIRLYLLSTHYRDIFEHDEDSLLRAQHCADAIRAAAMAPVEGAGQKDDSLADRVRAALDDDLDTPRAIRELSDAAEALSAQGPPSYRARKAVRDAAGLLGLKLGAAPEKL